MARHMMAFANVIVYNYQYMLDPKVSQVGGFGFLGWGRGVASVGWVLWVDRS